MVFTGHISCVVLWYLWVTDNCRPRLDWKSTHAWTYSCVNCTELVCVTYKSVYVLSQKWSATVSWKQWYFIHISFEVVWVAITLLVAGLTLTLGTRTGRLYIKPYSKAAHIILWLFFLHSACRIELSPLLYAFSSHETHIYIPFI